jgi:hypothetical protein
VKLPLSEDDELMSSVLVSAANAADEACKRTVFGHIAKCPMRYRGALHTLHGKSPGRDNISEKDFSLC